MTGQHASAPPSSMARIIQCAFSRKLCAIYPQEPNDEKAMEGVAAHWVLERVVHEETPPEEGATAPNGVLVTGEMLDGAEMFFDAVTSDFKGALSAAHIEERVDCSQIHPECWGTPDYWAFDEKTGILYVYDYKFGHRFVNPFENWQLLTYLTGILWKLGARVDILRIELRIVQPRNYHKDGPIRTWSISPKEVPAYAKRISEAVYASFQNEPQATTGPECDYCSGRHACTVLQEKSMRAVEVSRRGIPIQLSPEAAGSELRMILDAIRTLEARATGLEASVIQAIHSGKRIVGLDMESSQGRETWTVPISEVISLGEAMEISLVKPAVLTPNQARKAGMEADLVKGFSDRKPGAAKLVLSNMSKARQAFQQQESTS